MKMDAESYVTGYQGSRTDRLAIYFFPFPTSDNLGRDEMLTFDWDRQARGDRDTQVTGFSMSRLVSDHGTFTIHFSFANTAQRLKLRKRIHEDDYVLVDDHRGNDLIFGFVDSIVEEDDAASDGETRIGMTVSGYGWGERLRRTEIWFDILREGVLGASAVATIFNSAGAFAASPSKTVQTALVGFLQTAGQLGKAQWRLPPSLQRVFGASHLVDSILYDFDGFVNSPYRVNSLQPSLFLPDQQNIWEYVLSWADLAFCELFTDTCTGRNGMSLSSRAPGSPVGASENHTRFPGGDSLTGLFPIASGVSDFRPLVVYRDRPFPSSTLRSKFAGRGKTPLTLDNPFQPWRNLPLFRIPRQLISHRQVGMSAAERRNAFFLQMSLPPGLLGTYASLVSPLKAKSDAERYGVRRMDVQTAYFPLQYGKNGLDQAGIDTMKTRARDFYCANHLFASGTLNLVCGLPTIRVGSRVQVVALQRASLDPNSVESIGGDSTPDEMFYVEGYSHHWTLGSNLRTQLTVTRGLAAKNDVEYIDQIKGVISGYSTLTSSTDFNIA